MKNDHKNGSRLEKGKKRPGEVIRERALYAAPTIIIVYPLVGFALGWLAVRYWNWPFWVPIVTMLMALAQAIRELVKLNQEVYGKKDRE